MASGNDFFSKLIEKTEPIAEFAEMLQTKTQKDIKTTPITKAAGDLAGFNGLENMLHLVTMLLNRLIGCSDLAVKYLCYPDSSTTTDMVIGCIILLTHGSGDTETI